MLTGNRVKRVLKRFDVHLGHYRFTGEARRASLLRHAGIQDLLDVGANTGQYALGVRRHGYKGRIWSFEPMAGPFAELARAAAGDPGWQAICTAVGDETGELTLHVSADTQYTSALKVTEGSRPSAVQAGSQVVPCDTLDSLVPRLQGLQGPLGLKVDVQGLEPAVLAGARETLKEVQFLELEMSCVEVYAGQELLPAIITRLYEIGFVLALTESAWLLEDGRGLQMNGIFVRADARS